MFQYKKQMTYESRRIIIAVRLGIAESLEQRIGEEKLVLDEFQIPQMSR